MSNAEGIKIAFAMHMSVFSLLRSLKTMKVLLFSSNQHLKLHKGQLFSEGGAAILHHDTFRVHPEMGTNITAGIGQV